MKNSKPNKNTSTNLAVRPLNPQEVQLRPAPLWSKALAWTIISTASFGFIFAVFAKIDEVVLAPGELQPLGAERPVKAPFAGVIKDIVVKEGQKVKISQRTRWQLSSPVHLSHPVHPIRPHGNRPTRPAL